MIASLIDHTILKPEATRSDIIRVCAEARELGLFSVCVNSWWVELAAEELDGSQVRTCTVAGFPLGAVLTKAKVSEASEAIRLGASEIDMVISVGALRSGETSLVSEDIRAVAAACHAAGALLKVIIETALLSESEKKLACALSAEAGSDFVKTSTGFAAAGATAEDVALMRSVVGPAIGVKASGGIRTLADVRRMIAAGANRIGTSAGVSILRELRSEHEAAAMPGERRLQA